MATLGMILVLIGYIVMFVGGIWILILAFQESIAWGLGCLCIPLVSLIFVIMNWDTASKPFLIQIGGAVLLFGGIMLGGSLPMQ